jgi:RNA polymerase sigma-70 factor (ECF subfamily)
LDCKFVIREIQNKNHAVFKKLFEDLYAELVIYANRYLFDRNQSEDIVQEVFVYLWEKSDMIMLKGTLKGYMYAMVRYKCLNVLKTIKVTDANRALALHAVFDSEEQSEIFTAEENNSILYNQVLKILENLPVQMRTIVRLRFINNYRYVEIAEELGVSVNTVKTQLKRAKIKVSKQIIAITGFLSLWN